MSSKTDLRLITVYGVPYHTTVTNLDICEPFRFDYATNRDYKVDSLLTAAQEFFGITINNLVDHQPPDLDEKGNVIEHTEGDGSGKCCLDCKGKNGTQIMPGTDLLDYKLNGNVFFFDLPEDYSDEYVFKDGKFVLMDDCALVENSLYNATIVIRTMMGKEETILVDLQTWTVKMLKYGMKLQMGIPMNQMRLIFAGKQLDDAKFLKDYYIQEGCTLNLMLRLRGC